MKYPLPVWGLFMALLLCTPVSASFAQSPNTGTPPEAPCQKAGALKIQQQIGSRLAFGRASLLSPEISGKNVLVDGTFTIDRDFTFKNCEILMLPGASIVVEKGPAAQQERVLKLDNAHLYAASCDQLWNGIFLGDFTRIETRNDTRIEDAQAAITATGCAQLSVSYTTFNRNWIGISLNPSADCVPTITHLQGVHFTCTSELNGGSPAKQSYAGIVTRNVPIVANSGVGAINVNFSGLRFGILDQSDNDMPLTILGRAFRFRQMSEDGISVNRGNIDLRDCEFQNCEARGIDARTIHRLVVNNARFRFDDQLPAPASTANRVGIFVQNFAIGAQMKVFKSGFISNVSNPNNKITGIWLDGKSVGAGTDVQVYTSSFDFTGHRFFGIHLNGNFPPQSRVQIFGNSFVMEGLGTSADANAINCVNGDKNNIQIFSNNPFDGKYGGNRANAGIYLSGSSGAGNFVKDNVFPTDYSYLGEYWNDNMANAILAINFQNTEYCGNDIGDCAVQFRMLGNDLGTKIHNNVMHGGSISFLVDGFIGTQGASPLELSGPHIASGNQWYRKFPLLKATAWAECAGDCDKQPIIVQTDPTKVTADSPSFYPNENVNPADWFKYDPKSTIQVCGLTEFGGSGSDDRLNRSIADGGALQATPAETRELERHLYRRLTSHPELTARYAGYERFLSRNRQTNLGKFNAVSQSIDAALTVDASLVNALNEQYNRYDFICSMAMPSDENTVSDRASDAPEALPELLRQLVEVNTRIGSMQQEQEQAVSLKLREARQENQSVVTSTVFEENEKTVNDILLQNLLAPNEDLNASQLAVLRSIAAQCAEAGGQAVYRARGLLPADEQDQYTDEALGCRSFEVGGDITESEEPEVAGNPVSVFPNPASTFITLQLPEGTERAQFRLFSQTGQLVLEQPVSQTEKQVFLNGIANGTYTYQVFSGSGGVVADRLVVQRD